VRTIDAHPYCVGGPQVTPHILAQQLLQPQSERVLTMPLEPGRYRVRALELPGGLYLSATADGVPEATVCTSEAGWQDAELRVDLSPTLHLANETDQEQLLLLERMAWTDDAATAAEVTTLQAFRDLFSSEVLRPGEQISVGSLTIVFTDLRDSTRLYRAIGDAPAFGLVMDHFDVLRQAVAAQNGAIVKTIGDAIMAAFRHPLAGLRAILEAQERLRAVTDGNGPLVLKAGIHHGPCIAVTLNDRLDYFGSTVNIASRLQGLSAGDDIVVSAAVRDDPEVVEWWAQAGDSIAGDPFQTALKGFEGLFDVVRVTRKLTRPESADADR
jgi:class 3 adenylate cyclase